MTESLSPQWTTGIAVVMPCYRVTQHVLGVITAIGPEVDRIYVVDDCCPDGSGRLVEQSHDDSRTKVIFNEGNQGVGGATLRGMSAAFADGATIVVKIDGDGQMNPGLIRDFVAPLQNGDADYTKGNRFYELEGIRQMPLVRVVGNAALSFATKLSSGYWDIFDPTNGFLAIHRSAFDRLSTDKVNKRYFFESDLLFRLFLVRAVVVDIPMHAVYGDEKSSLKVGKAILPFAYGHWKNFLKRLFYTYFLRDFSIASIYLVIGPMLVGFGIIFGLVQWVSLARQGLVASAGTVMLSGLPVLLGFQLLLSFLNFDIANIPRYPLQRRVATERQSHSVATGQSIRK